MPRTLRPPVALAATIALSLNAAALVRAEVALGAATPQALVQRMTRAADAGDFAEILACIDPASRTEMAMGLVMATTMMVAFMSMGSETAGGLADGTSGGTAEEKAAADKRRAEASARTAQARAGLALIFKKHGLPDLMDEASAPRDEAAATAMLARADHAALAGDLLKFMETFGDRTGGDGKAKTTGPVNVPRNVTDYKITGARATARAGAETLEFVKVGERWFFKPPQKAEPN